MCHCLPPRKSEFEPFFGKIKISTFPVTECHLIIIKNDLQSYSIKYMHKCIEGP